MEEPGDEVTKIIRNVQTNQLGDVDYSAYRQYDDSILSDINAKITPKENEVKEKLKEIQERYSKNQPRIVGTLALMRRRALRTLQAKEHGNGI